MNARLASALVLALALVISACNPAPSPTTGPVTSQSLTTTLTSAPITATITAPLTDTASPTASPTSAPTDTRTAATFAPTSKTVSSTADPPEPSSTPGLAVLHKIIYTSCEYKPVYEGTALSYILDSSTCEIYLMNADGSGQTRLTNNRIPDLSPAGSPDSAEIAYVSQPGENSEIYVMNADGTNPTRLTSTNYDEREPEWSPDGTKILYTVYHRNGISEIKLMNADSSDQRTLIKNETDEGSLYSPAWSPDGKKIAFVVEGFNQYGYSDIYIMNADGSNPKQITHNNRWSQNPAWSPDGGQIAYETYNSSGGIYIFLMNPDGSGQINRSKSRGWDANPNWSPDGTMIVFQSDRDQPLMANYDIYIMSANYGTDQVRLTWNEGSISPDWLTFVENPIIQHPDCSSGWSRLSAGEQAQVSTQSADPNQVRPAPSVSEEHIALLDPGSPVRVLEGPVCADGLVF